MAKPVRNDPCPCGSGNKYKKCCLAKEEAASLSGAEDADEDELTIASNAAAELVRAGKLDEPSKL
jgi:hypothetical protein